MGCHVPFVKAKRNFRKSIVCFCKKVYNFNKFPGNSFLFEIVKGYHINRCLESNYLIFAYFSSRLVQNPGHFECSSEKEERFPKMKGGLNVVTL